MYINEKMLSPKWKSVEVSGCLIPFRDGQPILIQIPDNPHSWVAIFSTSDKLEKSCLELGIKSDYSIKQITDGKDFANSILESGLRIMLDPYHDVDQNKTRWTEVKRE